MEKRKTKRMEHVWSIICSNSTTDTQSNNISLFNVVEKFSIVLDTKKKKEGAMLIPFNQEIVTRFRRLSGGTDIPFEIVMEIITPSGKTVKMGNSQTLAFPKKFSNLRVRSRIENISVDEQGVYYFLIKFREVGDSEFIEGGVVPIEINIADKKEVKTQG